MRGIVMVLAGGAAFALAACGSDAADALTAAEAESAQSTSDGTSATPEGADLPGGFTLYPGATIVGNTTYTTDTGFNTIVQFESDDAPTTITAFYKKQAEAAGFEIQLESNMDGKAGLIGENAEKMAFALSASPGTDGFAGTEAQLTIGQDSR